MEAAPDKSRAVAHYTEQAALAAALDCSKVLTGATLWPYIVRLTYVAKEGNIRTDTHVVEASIHNPPDGLDLLPDDAETPVIGIFPAANLIDMEIVRRPTYVRSYEVYLMWRKAKSKGMKVCDMKPWKDYDPVHIDESVRIWVNPFVRYCGD